MSIMDMARRGLASLAQALGLGKPKRLPGSLSVAIVGEFQRGKSTLANALLGRNAAKRGRGLATTHANRSFPLTSRTTLVDTPGFDANRKDTGKALKALETSDVFLYVHESKTLGETCAGLFRAAREAGKTVIFLLNCRNFEKWAPEENDDIVSAIEAELANKGLSGNILAFGGRRVTPINALWACFGAGLLEAKSKANRADIQKIRRYAADDLWIPGAESLPEETLRAEMSRRSGVPEVRDWLVDLPIRKLRDFMGSPEAAVERILDRIATELQNREPVH